MSTGAEPILVIVGPTASGKTGLAIEVARRVDGEIISMDSRQVYRGMDLGTAKATPSERAAAPHHGLDLVDPDERFSAGKFAAYARTTIAAIRARGRVPILVGGTGFFLRALTNPIFREPELDPARRAALAAYLQGMTGDEMLRWLQRLDPESARRLSNGGGRQRLMRALEMALLTGRTLSWWHRHAPPAEAPVRVRVFVLDPPRDALYQAIDARVDAMLRAGLLDEVRALRAAGFGPGDPGMNATGYAELIPVLDGTATLEQAAERIRANTRAYARRQITWLRHQLPEGTTWLDPTAHSVADLADAIARNLLKTED